jgi:hypothetical protein
MARGCRMIQFTVFKAIVATLHITELASYNIIKWNM